VCGWQHSCIRWGSHFKWISPDGKEKLVRYYYKSAQGVISLDDDAAVQQPFSFATADLYNSIEAGDFPKWTVYVQMVDPDNNPFDFDPLDTTKQWPVTAAVPLVEVGVLEFNKNVDNQFTENEMIAFAPSRLVPGIEPSDEKMLQARLFAYADAQRYRLGVNNQMLPINAPRCPFTDRHVEGVMNFADPASTQAINYFPSFANPSAIHEAPAYHHETEKVEGQKVREPIQADDFTQAAARYASWDDARKLRFARRVASTLSGPNVSSDLLDYWINVWTQVNPDLAVQILRDVKHMKTDQLDVKIEEAIRKEHAAAHQFKKSFMRAAGAHH
jgi:catalase